MMSIWEEAPKNSRAVFEYLKHLAKKMRVETYGEIAAAIGKQEGREIAPISMNRSLLFIRDRICRPKGLPWLNSLAVSAHNWLPGESFLPEGVAFGGDEKVLWRGAVMGVFGYPWDKVNV
jgi:alkylated DNA nucleotide flippase Atl1